MKRLFSGSAPSGNLTIGNYLGAIKQWKEYQDTYDCLFCIVDMHALTVPKDPVQLRKKTLDFLALYLACGLEPEKSTIFIQSHNPQHAELAWILTCLTGHGELMRMTQFKDKSKQKGTLAGLLTYPILMAADILLYETEIVPVGQDQKQHLELTRTLAERFNRRYGKIFILPEPFIPKKTGKIMNLQDPQKKMDKSHLDPRTFLSLLDCPEEIRKKIRKAKTDSRGDFPIHDPGEGIANLMTIYSAITGLGNSTIVWEYEHRGYGALKTDLADLIIDFLRPIQREFRSLREDESYLTLISEKGRDKSQKKSENIMNEVRDAVGFTPPF